jgi:hypothetical protein
MQGTVACEIALSGKKDVSEKRTEEAVSGKCVGLKLFESDHVCGIDRLRYFDRMITARQDHLCAVIRNHAPLPVTAALAFSH